MINTFRLKKIPTVQACQWNGENVKEINTFLFDMGSVRGEYVEYGGMHLGRPIMNLVRVGDYLVKSEDGCFTTMTTQELLDKYELED